MDTTAGRLGIEERIERAVAGLCSDPAGARALTVYPTHDLAYAVWEAVHDRVEADGEGLNAEEEGTLREHLGRIPVAFVPAYDASRQVDVDTAAGLAHIGQVEEARALHAGYRPIEGVVERVGGATGREAREARGDGGAAACTGSLQWGARWTSAGGAVHHDVEMRPGAEGEDGRMRVRVRGLDVGTFGAGMHETDTRWTYEEQGEVLWHREGTLAEAAAACARCLLDAPWQMEGA